LVSERLRPGRVHVGKYDNELIAAGAVDGVLLAHGALETPGDADQVRIADGVAQRVVDRLEVVEVDEQQRKGPAGTDQAVERRAQLDAVRQTRQRIVVRQKFDVLLRPALLGDVDAQAQDAGRRRVGERERDLRGGQQVDVVLSIRHLLFDGFRHAGAHHLGVVAPEVRGFYGRFLEVRVLLAFELRHRGAVGSGNAFVRQHVGAFRVLREDEVRDQIDDLPQQGSVHHVGARWSLQLHYRVPGYQRLDVDHPVGSDGHDRLVDLLHLVGLESVVELKLALGDSLDLIGEERRSVASRIPDNVERAVRIPHQHVGTDAMLGVQRDADAARTGERQVDAFHRLSDRVQ